jgi:hypothetical protein
MKFRLTEYTEEFSSAYSARSATYDAGSYGLDSFSCVAVLDVDTPAAVIVASASIVFATGTWTSAAHGFSTGLKVQLTTSSALPAPLLVATDYYVIVVTANTFKLASTLNNAIAGTAITLSDAGVGNQTVTPVALAGGAIKLQQSNDGSTWVDLGSSTNVTVDANVLLEKDRPTCRYISVYVTLTAGHISASFQILGKGDKD